LLVKRLEASSCPAESSTRHNDMQAINTHRKHKGIQRARERVTMERGENIPGIIPIQDSILK